MSSVLRFELGYHLLQRHFCLTGGHGLVIRADIVEFLQFVKEALVLLDRQHDGDPVPCLVHEVAFLNASHNSRHLSLVGWCAPEARPGGVVTNPDQMVVAPDVSCETPASRTMPVVWAVLQSRSDGRMILIPGVVSAMTLLR